MSRIHVRLTWHEVMTAAMMGIRRYIQNRERGYALGEPLTAMQWGKDIEGCAGEVAGSRHLDVYWSGALGDFKASDAGPAEMRTNCSRTGRDMLFRPYLDRLKLSRCFIAVTSFCPDFYLEGWCWGWEAALWCEPHRLPDGKTSREGRLCWYVPVGKLHDMAWLPSLEKMARGHEPTREVLRQITTRQMNGTEKLLL